MNKYSRLIQVILLVVAAGTLSLAGYLHGPILDRSREAELITPQAEAALKQNPEVAFLTSVPGGLRILGINYLWIRAQDAHQEGRHFDAYQLAELICQLQPYQPSVWIYQAWQMAWNISVTKDSREERWKWIYNGVKLLRDQAIPLNSRSLVLYKELSWIFFSKIAGQLDQKHLSYKQRWAGIMQFLLGAPPYQVELGTTLEESTQQVIDAFRPIAKAPLDRDLGRQGEVRFQPDIRETLLSDPQVKAYADLLVEAGLGLDDTFLAAWNHWSLDPGAASVRQFQPTPETTEEQALSDLINAPEHAEARLAILSWIRAQILWNEYRMDPAYMLELMERYNVPLDWRHALSHSLYWASIGIDRVQPEDPEVTTVLNNARNVLNSLKLLYARGLLAIQLRPVDPEYPSYNESPDLRYIEPTHQEHLRIIDTILAAREASGKPIPFEQNVLDAGHVNFLIDSIQLLVADGRIGTAQDYYDWIKETYKRTDNLWQNVRVEQFVIDQMKQEYSLRYVIAKQLMEYSLKRAFIALGLRGDEETFTQQRNFAQQIYKTYQENAVGRMRFRQSIEELAVIVGRNLLAQPGIYGLNLSPGQRSDIYLALRREPEVQLRVYDILEQFFQRFATRSDLKMEVAFPRPPGLEAYRRRLRQERLQDRPEDAQR